MTRFRSHEPFQPLRFGTIVYPVWRRKMPAVLKDVAVSFMSRYAPVSIDQHPPLDASEMAQYLVDWGIMSRVSATSLARDIANSLANVAVVDMTRQPRAHDGSKIRVPAQWETIERVLISWAVIYPAVWHMHAQMAETISAVALVEIVVPTEAWAHGVWVYLSWRGLANLDNVRFTVVATNDIWIRDYGAIAGLGTHGERVLTDCIYDVLPNYPQHHDNAFNTHYCAHQGHAHHALDLHFEGGNLWSDGQGTFIISEQIFHANRFYTRDRLFDLLTRTFDVQKIIITPRLVLEETGHVDLVVKLVDVETVFVSAPEITTADALRRTKRLFERETNAHGQAYHVVELPTPALYLNWGVYPTRRHYTNALTVNGRVLVPTFGIDLDEVALRLYQEHMPEHEVVPIDSRVGINGGGAVHCMTKEIF